MDYETFCSSFPSQKFIDAHLISKSDWVALYKEAFDKSGPGAVSMSDVTFSRLCADNVIVEGKRGKPVLMAEMFDTDMANYRRIVVEPFREFVFRDLAILIRSLQSNQDTDSPITITKEGNWIFKGRSTSLVKGKKIPKDTFLALIADLYGIISVESYQWGQFGMLALINGVLTLTIKPRAPEKPIPKSCAKALIIE